MELRLQDIAKQLEALEDTIIFRCIDRAQYAQNRAVYEEGRFDFRWSNEDSLLTYKHRFSEETDAVLGRFRVPEERPFFSELPEPAESLKDTTDVGLYIEDYNSINVTKKIRQAYLDDFVFTGLSKKDDGEYGTTVELDIFCLQALSRRIHFGAFFVAEAKYQADPEVYDALIMAKDRTGLWEHLTRQSVENAILQRVEEKVQKIQEVSKPDVRVRIAPQVLTAFYKNHIIPLTKEGEVQYLLNRVR
ncbi:chorismate mutase [Chitinivibrio alkaliphilus]|uniref:Chorismate mutase n=1 Tax=Chitinivibrio alkaliphilus ACht1 TaxID=1313304 RepID=U7D9A0_9BACT|nr:chorismate mutase [Chitinivibrio alkaliphilus]ERP30980.1 hypothetical protein CALK_2176 [Chitinivibrio alkaliphilus ACht1]